MKTIKFWGSALTEPPCSAPKESLLRSEATILAGVMFGAFTLAFLMWVVLAVDQTVQCSKIALIALTFGLGTALSTSFIGGYASAKGPIAIPQLGNKPIGIALGGGFLALLIATGVAWFVVRNGCESVYGGCNPQPPLTTRISCGKIFRLQNPPMGDGFLVVRTGPTTLCAKKAGDDLHNNDQVIVLATQDKWLYVKRFSTPPFVEGWSFVDYIDGVECPPDAPTK